MTNNEQTNEAKRLTHIESHRVCVWLEAKREFLEKTECTFQELTDSCRKATGVDVSKASLVYLMKELEITKFTPPAKQTKATNAERLDAVEQFVMLLDAKIEAIMRDMKCKFVKTGDNEFSVLSIK